MTTLQKTAAVYRAARHAYAHADDTDTAADEAYTTARAEYFAALADAHAVEFDDVCSIAAALGPVDDLDALPLQVEFLKTLNHIAA